MSGGRNYVSLDTLEERELAKNDPRRFLERYEPPLLLDEILYALELFPYIKNIIDKEKKKGMYWITGSQQFNLNELQFVNFVRVLAARTSQLLNYSNIAREIGITETTVKSWLSILQTSGIIYLLQPYSNNLTNRVLKTPKVYFLDTGLVCYLTKRNTPEALENGAFSGAILETYVISEILKSYWHNGVSPAIYFYGDKDKREIDIILEENGKLYPLEIKQKTSPTTADIKNLPFFPGLRKKSPQAVCYALRRPICHWGRKIISYRFRIFRENVLCLAKQAKQHTAFRVWGRVVGHSHACGLGLPDLVLQIRN
jgi:predicted AAA+ superfamily ATPase